MAASTEHICLLYRRDEMADKKVQCVPGGHLIPIDKAYWCNQCGQYLCYDHARTSYTVNTVKCPKGHEVSKAR